MASLRLGSFSVAAFSSCLFKGLRVDPRSCCLAWPTEELPSFCQGGILPLLSKDICAIAIQNLTTMLSQICIDRFKLFTQTLIWMFYIRQIWKPSWDMVWAPPLSFLRPPQTPAGSNVCPAGLKVPVKSENKHQAAAQQPRDQAQTFKALQRVGQSWGESTCFWFFTSSWRTSQRNVSTFSSSSVINISVGSWTGDLVHKWFFSKWVKLQIIERDYYYYCYNYWLLHETEKIHLIIISKTKVWGLLCFGLLIF